MKNLKKSNSWRGGRGRSRVSYQIFPDTMQLIRWYDGSYEWILKTQTQKICNKTSAFEVKGHNTFPTRRSAERAINKLPCAVTLQKAKSNSYWCIKGWLYPASKKPLPPIASSARHFLPGSLIAFSSDLSLYDFDLSDLLIRSTHWVVKGTFGIVLSSPEDGLITQVFSDNFSGWVESKYLCEVKR